MPIFLLNKTKTKNKKTFYYTYILIIAQGVVFIYRHIQPHNGLQVNPKGIWKPQTRACDYCTHAAAPEEICQTAPPPHNLVLIMNIVLYPVILQ